MTMFDCELAGEPGRLDALRDFEILDTPPEESFDRITRLAVTVTGAPIALVSLVDEFRQWFKSKQGLDADETSRDVSFCAHAIEQNGPLVVENALEDERFKSNPLVTGDPRIRFYAGAPLITRSGHKIGTICVIDTKVRTLTDQQIAVLEDLARLVIDEMELRLVAVVDSLTGAMSRKAFLQAAERDFAGVRRTPGNLCVAVLDVDKFKEINDRYGHSTGDRVLQNLVALCKESLRETDYIGRIGGEEFAVVMPDTAFEEGSAIAERLRSAVQNMTVETRKGTISPTVSIGLAGYVPSIASLDRLMNAADRAMYRAKTRGRNRVVGIANPDNEPAAA